MILPAFNSHSRLMMFAPHPDDEVLGCGIMLQRARAASAATRVVFITDGENNPWPQRFLERKWRLDERDRQHWGQLRRAESLAALQVLGHDSSTARFLAMPDQGLTTLLVKCCSKTLATLTRSITDWAPTHLLIPSATDIHPDHSAAAVMLSLVLQRMRDNGSSGSVWSYAVHRQSAAFCARAYPLPQSGDETARKMQAVLCHESQLKLSRRRFLAYAARCELWQHIRPGEAGTLEGSIYAIQRKSSALQVQTRLSMKAALLPDPILFLLGRDELENIKCVRLRVPDCSSKVAMLDAATGCSVGAARYSGNAFSGQLFLSPDLFSQRHPLFVKLVHWRLFFDEAGWIEIPPLNPAEQLGAPGQKLAGRVLSTIR